MGRRWLWLAGIGVLGCTGDNPAFEGDAGEHDHTTSGAGSASAPSTSGGPGSAGTDGSASGSTSKSSETESTTSSTTVATSSTSEPTSTSESTSPSTGASTDTDNGGSSSTGDGTGALIVFGGPVIEGDFAVGQPEGTTFEYAAGLCEAAIEAAGFDGCVDPAAVRPVLRAAPHPVLDATVYPEGWGDLPVTGPSGGMVASSLSDFLTVEMTLLDSLAAAGVTGENDVFWSGGYDNVGGYLDCEDWRNSADLGDVGDITNNTMLWFTTGEEACTSSRLLLCICERAP